MIEAIGLMLTGLLGAVWLMIPKGDDGPVKRKRKKYVTHWRVRR